MRLLILLALLFTCTYADRNITNEVLEFVNEVRAIESSSFPRHHKHNKTEEGVLARLQSLADITPRLLRLGISASEFIAAGTTEKFENGSDEERTMAELNSLFKSKIWKSLYGDPLDSLPSGIHAKLTGWNSTFDGITDSNENLRSVLKREFINSCYKGDFKNSPNGMIRDLEDLYRKRCSMPTEENIALLVRVQQAFHHFETRIHETADKLNKRDHFNWILSKNYGYGKYHTTKNAILPNIFMLSPESVNDLISLLDNAKTSNIYQDSDLLKVIEDVVYGIRGRHPYYAIYDPEHLFWNPCLLEAHWNANYQRRGPFLVAMNFLTNKILQLEVMLSSCVHIDNHVCTACIDRDFDDFSARLQSISRYIQKWLDRAQNLSFPQVGIEAVKQDIGIKEIHRSDYNETAEMVHRLFEERGGYDKSNRVLIASTDDDHYWMKGNTTGRYVNFTINGGSIVHVFQFDSNDGSVNEKKARTRTNKYSAAIREVISEHSTDSASDIMSALSSNTSTKSVLVLHRAAILFGRRSFFKKNAEVATGLSQPTSNATNIVDYEGNGIYKRNWKLFLFT